MTTVSLQRPTAAFFPMETHDGCYIGEHLNIVRLYPRFPSSKLQGQLYLSARPREPQPRRDAVVHLCPQSQQREDNASIPGPDSQHIYIMSSSEAESFPVCDGNLPPGAVFLATHLVLTLELNKQCGQRRPIKPITHNFLHPGSKPSSNPCASFFSPLGKKTECLRFSLPSVCLALLSLFQLLQFSFKEASPLCQEERGVAPKKRSALSATIICSPASTLRFDKHASTFPLTLARLWSSADSFCLIRVSLGSFF